MTDNPNRNRRRSRWIFAYEDEEPTYDERVTEAARLSAELGTELTAPKIPTPEDLELRAPRVKVPDKLAPFTRTDNYERAMHTYSSYSPNREAAIRGEYPNPVDVVAHPRTDEELERTLTWASDNDIVAIPYGAGSSVVDGTNPPAGADAVVTIDMDEFDQVLEIDETSRAARIQAGVYGPHLESQLRPRGFTLRHFPQSFALSTLGGWIATRSGGHYATNHTHIDDFVESTRMLTPNGWWESRRLPGSGAGTSPDRVVIGSEGILGVITEAWMRVQARPTFRATAAVTFNTWEQGYEATRQIVQAKLWPANLRILDPLLAGGSAGLDGNTTLLIVGFESAELSQREPMARAIEIARGAGGHIPDDDILVDDGDGNPTGRAGAVGAWRDAFIPKGGGLQAGLGMIGGTTETSITWDRWPDFDHAIREAYRKVLDEECGGGTVNCRFTHVYTDGPAPYYTYAGAYKGGDADAQERAVKHAVSEAIEKNGGTITHHHAVGRLHRPQYDRQRPDLFADALRAAKKSVDPNGILNPGVLIDP